MKKILEKVAFLLIALTLVVTVPLTTEARGKDDITGHHHEDALREMINKGVMSGYGDGIYKPNGQVTRGQFAAIIARALKLEEPDEGIVFTDLHEKSGVVEEVIAAAGADIITGYPDGTFKPANKISRQHMAVIVERALKYMDMEDKLAKLDFADTDLILKTYRPAVSNTVGYEIFSGSPKNGGVYFRPTDNAERGDAAAVMSRFLSAVKLDEEVPPVVDKPAPPVEKPTPPVTKPDPPVEKPTPPVTKPNPPVEKPTPPVTKPNPPVEKPTPPVTKPDPPVEKPTPPVTKPDPTFDTGSIQANGDTKVLAKYKTYKEALVALKNNQVITYGDSIIHMPGGIVITKPTLSSSLTNIYTRSDLRTAETYVSADTELEYVSSTDKYVQVKLAGRIGFIKHDNAILTPWKAVKERSYYTVSKGSLHHHIYSNVTGKYSVVNEVGAAPKGLVAGQKYFSWDNINYFHANGSKAATGYQYFQYLPARSTTNYTASEIDAYILKMLKSLETNYPNSATYKNASKRSKLVGLGSYLKEVEKKHKVNAMLVLALAQHESAYGLSVRAQDFNNLFGIRVFDDNPDDLHFKTVEASIDTLMTDYFNKNYIPPNAKFANGAVFGNKAMGFNMKYASDPYWGEKAAGHWYRADKMMGGKDAAKAYKVGLTTASLNVRTGPSTSNRSVYKYSKDNMPVIIAGKAKPSPWLIVGSDTVEFDNLYSSGDFIKEILLIK